MACPKSGRIPLFMRAWVVSPFAGSDAQHRGPYYRPAELERLAVQIFAGPTFRMR